MFGLPRPTAGFSTAWVEGPSTQAMLRAALGHCRCWRNGVLRQWIRLTPVGCLVALLALMGSRAAGDEACPVPADARATYPRKILAPGQQPWWVKRSAPPADALPRAPLPAVGSDERRGQVRRLTFLITGLPPRPDDVDAFVADPSPRALDKLIDTLQAAPTAPQRLTQWWIEFIGYLDRWADAAPNAPQPVHAWRYRDWVIDAFDEPLRLSQFLRLHLVGDTMAGPEPGVPNRAGLTATSWFLFGPAPRGTLADATAALARHQADRTARVFLGADFSCARCHDHPALPLSRDEYTSWVSIFSHHHSLVAAPDGSPVPTEVPTVSANRLAQRTRELAALAELESKLAADHREFSLNAAGEFLPQTAEYVRSAWTWHRQPQPSLEEFCAERGLQPGPLQRWLSALGLTEPSHPASSKPWWKQWTDARASGDQNRIAEAAREIEKVHVADESSPFFDLSPDALKWLTLDQQTQISRLEKKVDSARQKLTSDHPVHAIVAGPVPDGPAPTASPRLPPLIIGNRPHELVPPTSGRLALSAWLDAAGRPLVTRLFVHRLWIASGQPPLVTNELDWWRPDPPAAADRLEALASILTAGDGSLASVQKQILLAAPTGDPLTLSEEECRDAVLFVSGQLDPRQFGPPSTSPDSRRRSLYRVWTEPRKPSPLLRSFLESQANALVQLASDSAGVAPATQSLWLTRRLLARPPSAQERGELTDSSDRAAVIAFGLTLLQSDEFRILR
jgi:Protein of unknown function (DUF1549)